MCNIRIDWIFLGSFFLFFFICYWSILAELPPMTLWPSFIFCATHLSFLVLSSRPLVESIFWTFGAVIGNLLLRQFALLLSTFALLSPLVSYRSFV